MLQAIRLPEQYLKSNMDRFIVAPSLSIHFTSDYLKSNMDRFIGFPRL